MEMILTEDRKGTRSVEKPFQIKCALDVVWEFWRGKINASWRSFAFFV